MAYRHRTTANAWLCSTTANLPMTLSSYVVAQNVRLLVSALRASMTIIRSRSVARGLRW